MAISHLHDAFISYSHATDASLARALEEGLEKIAKPLLKLRALDVFRDESSLSASPALWNGIVEHLSGSRWFLLMASSASAASAWCSKETAWWLGNRSSERMLVILTDGEIAWDGATSDFDWNRTTALSPSLSRRFPDEPRYVDLRWARDLPSLSLSDPRFRSALIDIAAPLRGMRKDELDSADVRQLRRNRVLVRGGVIAIALAGSVAVWQARLANQERIAAEQQRDIAAAARSEAERQRDKAAANEKIANVERGAATAAQAEAERQRSEAVRQRDAALARRLAIYATATATSSSDLAVLLAIESLRRTRFVETDSLLRKLIRSRPKTLAAATINEATTSASFYVWSFSPRSTYLVAGGTGNTATVWLSATLKELARFKHLAPITAAAFSPDERLLAIADGNRRVVLYQLSDGTARTLVEGLGEISSLAFSPNGGLLAVGLRTNYPGIGKQRNGHAVVDVGTGNQIAVVTASAEIGRVAFSPDGEYLATAGPSQILMLWDRAQRFGRSVATHAQVLQWEFDPGTGGLVVLTRDRALRTSQTPAAGAPVPWKVEGIEAFALSPDGSRLAAVRDGVIEVRGRDANVISRIPIGVHEGTRIEFRDGAAKLLVTGQRAQLFDVSDARELVAVDRRQSAWSQDGRVVATPEELPGGQKYLQFWEASGGETVARMRHGDVVCTIIFDPGGSRLLSASQDGTARVWNGPGGRELTRVTHKGPVTAAWFSPDGRTAVSAGRGEANWWRTDSGALLATAKYAPEFPLAYRGTGGCASNPGTLAVAFKEDDVVLAVAASVGQVEVWNLRSGMRVMSVKHPRDPDPLSESEYLRVALSTDGKLLATSNVNEDGPIRLWEVPSGRLISKLATLDWPGNKGMLLTRWREPSSPDGQYVVKVGEYDRRVPSIHQRDSEQPFTELSDQSGVNSAAFSPDGAYLAIAGSDKSVRLLLWKTDDLVRDACRRVTRNLTREEWDTHIGVGTRLRTCPDLSD